MSKLRHLLTSVVILCGGFISIAKAEYHPSKCDDIPPQSPTCFVSTSSTVRLYVGGSGDDQIKLGETSDLSSLPWVNNTLPYTYTFSPGGGIKTLYAQVKDHYTGDIESGSSTFTIDLASPSGYIEVNPSSTYGDPRVQITLHFYDYYDWVDEESDDQTPMLNGSYRIGENSDLSDAGWDSITNGTKTLNRYFMADDYPDGHTADHNFYYQFKDNAGLTSDISYSSIIVDKTPPTISAWNYGHGNTLEVYTNDDATGISKLYIAKESDYRQFIIDYDEYYKLTHHYNATVPSSFITINNPRSTENVTVNFNADDSRIVFVMALDGVGNYQERPTYMPDGTTNVTPVLPTRIPITTATITITGIPNTTGTIVPSDTPSLAPDDTDNNNTQDESDNTEVKSNTSFPNVFIILIILITVGVGGIALTVFLIDRKTHFIKKLLPNKKPSGEVKPVAGSTDPVSPT